MIDTNAKKFRKPGKGKGKGAPKAKLTRVHGDPVYTYISQCCSARGTKNPCARSGEATFDELALGSWRCSQCNRPAKVSRHRNKAEEPAQEVAA